MNAMHLNFTGRAWSGIMTVLLSSQILFGQAHSTDEILKDVAAIHGAAGVFAVAGYRMGERALKELDLPRGSFSIDVVHHTPMEVQWSCVADGLQAATGVSVGKLNLRLVEAARSQAETVVTNRKTGKQIVFRMQSKFLKDYLDIPQDRQPAAGREVAGLPESRIFTVEVRSANGKN